MPRAVPSRPLVGRLFVGAALTLAAVVVLCAASVGAYLSANRWVSHTLLVRDEVYSWLTSVIDAQAAARAYLAGAGSVSIESYDASLARARGEASRMQALIADSPAQVQNVEIAARDADTVFADVADVVSLARQGHWAEGVAAFDSTEKRDRRQVFRADIRRIHDEEERVLHLRRSSAEQRGWLAIGGAVLLALTSCLLLALAWRREQAHDRVLGALATDARVRLRALSELAQALSSTKTKAEVARVVVEHGSRAAGADVCTLYELDETGKTLTLIADRGVSPAVLDHIRTIGGTSGDPPALDTLTSGMATWAESEDDYAKLYPDVASLKVEGRRAKAFWSVPLIAEGASVGLLGAGFYEPRRFSDDERAFVETLTQHCAQALRRAARLERESETQGLLETTLWSIGDAVIATDTVGAVRYMNPVAQSLTGWEEGEARGRPLDEVFRIYSEETGAVIESPVAKVLREGTTVGLANHTFLRSKAGVDVPIADSGAPIRGEKGRALGVVLVFRDATTEKRERERSEFLAKAGEALATSIDYAATLATVARFAVPTLADWCAVELVDPATGTHRQAAVAHVNESKVRFARELGERYPPDRDAPTGVPQVIRSGQSELYTEIPRALLEAGARDPEHLRIIQDLQLRSAMIVALKLRGTVLGALTFIYAESGRRYTENDLLFAEDFARRAAMAIENAQALKNAEEARVKEGQLRVGAELANRAKDEFLATISHELRTPLNAILGWTTIARRRRVPDDVERALSIVERNARVQAKLIEDVLDTSRIISGKLALTLAATNVAEVVAAALESVAPAAEAKSIAITAETPDPSLTIAADAERLQQIVWNLVSNAVKFTPKGGQVALRASREGSDVCISVSDSGEGIRSSVLPLVFERFHQADASITRRHGGLGLGLSIVKQLVVAHGGTVSAESEGEGKGATFTVRLPARSAVPAVRSVSSASAQPVDLRAVTDAPRLDGLRLLVLDDEEDARELVGEVLRAQGAEVHLAGSAREALARFGDVRPDVIVSDIGMPEVDGFAFIRQIRALASDRGGRTPAVALTAYVRDEDREKAFAAGYQMHVAKPVEPAHLATVVASLGRRTSEGPTWGDGSAAS